MGFSGRLPLNPFLKQTSSYIAKNFNLTFDPEIYSRDLSKRIFLATSGYQAYVMQLIYQSCLSAMSNNRVVVSMGDFHTAYALKSILYKPQTKKDIFLLNSSQITEILI